MHRRRELLIGVLIGLSFMLLASLAAAIAPRSRMAYAQSNPWISISTGENTLPQGGATYLFGELHNMPQDPNDDGKFHPDLRYRFDLERNNEGTWTEANECEESSIVGSDNYIGTWYRSPLDVGTGYFSNLVIPSNCPVGSYRVLATAKYSPNTIIVTSTRELTVIHGPAMEIKMSSAAFYRGATSDVTMEFSYLNNLQDGSNLSYRADIMRIISDFYLNWANDCEGTGLGNIDKSDETNDNNYNFNNNPSGTIDDQDGDGAVEISGQIPATCPTGRYRLTVELWDSSKNDLTSASAEFVVSTDPNATPSAKVELSPPSPVAEGTEIDATITYYDIQNDTRIRFLAQVTKRVGGKDVVEANCHGSGIGLGQDFSSTVTRNPEVHRYVISSSCPAGSYMLSGVISDTAKNEIVSASAGFVVGNPPPPNELPVFTHTSGATYQAKVGRQFNQTLTAGSGGDGTLRYTATGLPQGLGFSSGNRTVSGIPGEDGAFVVTYKVFDDDNDEDSRTFTIEVEENFTPTFTNPPSGTYPAKEGRRFTLELEAGTGGDGTLRHWVEDLPSGLQFIIDTLTITGTLNANAAGNHLVTYKVADEDGGEASATFTIDVEQNATPTFDNPPSGTYPAKERNLFTLELEAGTGGDGTLRHWVEGLPGGLQFIATTFTITGTPSEIPDGVLASLSQVTYKVADEDGDEGSATFTIEVRQNEKPTLSDLSSEFYTAKERLPFKQTLPAASGGEGNLTHSVTGLPDGLEFNAATRKITGTPTTGTAAGSAEQYVVTYKVKDDDPEVVSTTFTIEVSANEMPTLTNLSSESYAAKERRLFEQDLPEASGGEGDLTHWVEGLPDGLEFNAATRKITGTPTTGTATGTTKEYLVTYKVEDEDPEVVSTTFKIVVSANVKPTLTDLSNEVYFAKEERLFTLVLPAGTLGEGNLTHWVEDLPYGLDFIPTTFAITGTLATNTADEYVVTYRVQDDDPEVTSTTFKIIVYSIADVGPDFRCQRRRKTKSFQSHSPTVMGG